MAAALMDSPDRGDEALIDEIRSGDHSSFDLLYRRYFPRVYRFVDRRLGNRADVEETVQEVFFNLFSRWRASAATRRSRRGSSASRAARSPRASSAAATRSVPLGDDEPEGVDAQGSVQREPDPHAVYEYNERIARMESAIEKDLSPEQWQLFQLHHIENRSIQEIALDDAEERGRGEVALLPRSQTPPRQVVRLSISRGSFQDLTAGLAAFARARLAFRRWIRTSRSARSSRSVRCPRGLAPIRARRFEYTSRGDRVPGRLLLPAERRRTATARAGRPRRRRLEGRALPRRGGGAVGARAARRSHRSTFRSTASAQAPSSHSACSAASRPAAAAIRSCSTSRRRRCTTSSARSTR